MRVLVISDTHRNIGNVIYLLQHVYEDVKAIIHCGDHIQDAYKLKEMYPDIAVYSVCGNCDRPTGTESYMRIVTLDDVKIMLTHGHQYPIKIGDYDEILIDAQANDVQIAICGHSHIAYLQKKEGILLLNPGSISLPRDYHYPSYALLELREGQILSVSMMQINAINTVSTHPIDSIYKNK